MSSIQDLIAQYGIIAVFAGCLMEGETFAAVGGFFAHQGILAPATVWIAAALGSFLGDAALYSIGHFFTRSAYVRRQMEKPFFDQAITQLRKRQTLFILSNRFIYGLRAVGGLAVGVAGVPARIFLPLNAIASVVWASMFVGSGYFFGASVQLLLGRMLHNHERLAAAVLLFVLLTAAAIFAIRHYRNKKLQRQ